MLIKGVEKPPPQPPQPPQPPPTETGEEGSGEDSSRADMPEGREEGRRKKSGQKLASERSDEGDVERRSQQLWK